MTTADRLIALLSPKPGERVLDVGCGLGDVTANIALLGARVTGLDRSPVLLEQARFRYPSVDWRCGDFLAIPPSPEFDAVFSRAAIHWIGQYGECARRLAGWLRPGGRLVVSLGGVTPALGMMEACLPSGAEWEFHLIQAGFVDVRVTIEPGLLLSEARRSA